MTTPSDIAHRLLGTQDCLHEHIEPHEDTLDFCRALDAIVLQCEVCGTWGDTDSDVKYHDGMLICNDCEAEGYDQ